MKKLLLVAIATLGMVCTSEAQEGFRLGAHLGLPVGDASDFTTFNVGVDASYLFDVTDVVDLGFSTGYTHFFGDDVGGFEVDDVSFIPIAASARALFGESVFYGADLGYAIGVNDHDGGFYYQGKIGWTNNSIDIFGFYRGISNDGEVSSIGVGVAYKLK